MQVADEGCLHLDEEDPSSDPLSDDESGDLRDEDVYLDDGEMDLELLISVCGGLGRYTDKGMQTYVKDEDCIGMCLCWLTCSTRPRQMN